MRSIAGCLILSLIVLGSGCASVSKKQPGDTANTHPTADGGKHGAGKSAPEKIIVTPSDSLLGTVVRVNAKSRYAILGFPTYSLPSKDTHVSAYRKGLKVADLKVTGPQEGDNTVADIVEGEVIQGDEIRTY